MTMLFRRRKLLAASAAAALTLGLVAGALQFSSTASASNDPCSDPVTSAPTAPATVSVASTAYGRVLVVGSGDYAGCSLYLLTSDELHAVTGAQFACSDNLNVLGAPCDSVLWPALLTDGAPIAGAGVDPNLLGTVTRTDLPGVGPVQQVTYAGYPLYRFTFDEMPGETEGANLFDPVTSPTGIWYLVEPKRGAPAPGQAQLQLETAPVGGIGSDQTVLAATMNEDFSLFADASFPVYTLSKGRGPGEGPAKGLGPVGHGDVCQTLCAQYWPPVLTSGRPVAGPGVDEEALGTVRLRDGSSQVTYKHRPLYLFVNDAYIPGAVGAQGIYGDGVRTLWGEFHSIPPLP